MLRRRDVRGGVFTAVSRQFSWRFCARFLGRFPWRFLGHLTSK